MRSAYGFHPFHVRAARLIAALALLCCALLAFAAPAGAEGAEYLLWRLEADNTVCITGWDSDGDVVEIPSEIEGHKVTAIGDGAFRNKTALEEVYFPETVVTIGEEAFAGCSSLWNADLTQGLREIKARAFKGSGNTSIFLPASLTRIGEDVFADSGLRVIGVTKYTYAEEWAAGIAEADPSIRLMSYPAGLVTVSASVAVPGEQVTCSARGMLFDPEYFKWQRSFDGDSWTDCWQTADREEYTFTASAKTCGCWYRVLAMDFTGEYRGETVFVGYLETCPALSARAAGTSVSLDWANAGDGVTYTVYMTGPDGRETVAADGIYDTFLDLDGLEADTEYTFRLEASHEDYTVGGDPVTVRTGEERTGTACRALLIGEVRHIGWNNDTPDSAGDLKLLAEMLGTVTDPEENPWSVMRKTDLTKAEIRQAIRTAFAGADEDDVSLFFIATHGRNSADAPEECGNLIIYNPELWSNEHITDAELAEWLGEIPGDVVVFLEACSSGSMIYSPEDQPGFGLPRPNGALRREKFRVLASSAHMEDSYAYPDDDFPHTLFTYGVTEGVGLSGRMPCDTDGDGLASLAEIHAWLGTFRDPYLVGDFQHAQIYPAGSEYKLFRRMRKTPEVTPPEPIEGLMENGEPQTLVTAGSTTGGTLLYALGEVEGNAQAGPRKAPEDGWGTALPQGTEAGDYDVWYKVEGDDAWKDVEPARVKAQICPVVEPTPDPTPEPTPPKPVPKTGDGEPVALWIFFVLAGACALVLARLSRKRG